MCCENVRVRGSVHLLLQDATEIIADPAALNLFESMESGRSRLQASLQVASSIREKMQACDGFPDDPETSLGKLVNLVQENPGSFEHHMAKFIWDDCLARYATNLSETSRMKSSRSARTSTTWAATHGRVRLMMMLHGQASSRPADSGLEILPGKELKKDLKALTQDSSDVQRRSAQVTTQSFQKSLID